MSDVFISYPEESAGELAEQIADALDDAGISAWCARRDMALGGNFAREIPNQIHGCRLFLLILNDNVYHSEHIENEVGIAFSRVNKKENILILPLELGDFTRKDWVEYYLIHTQSVKLPAQPDEKRLQRLVKQVAKALNRETQPAPKSATLKVQAKPAPIPQASPEVPPVEIIKRGQCGDNLTYTLDENGVLTISGNGPMWDFEWDALRKIRYNPWWEEHQTITEAKIETGVTTIGEGAFDECAKLRKVTLPFFDDMVGIGVNAFSGCVKLSELALPIRVMKLGEGVCYGCEGLTSVILPCGITKIEWGAFHGCKRMTRVTIPDGVTAIENEAFALCIALTSVIIPDSVQEIKSLAFAGCTNLKSVSVPRGTKIEQYAFPKSVCIMRRWS